MKLSLVICTRNRAVQLEKCLEAVNAMNLTNGFELIVVDNASQDSTAAVVEAFSERTSILVRYIFEQIPGLSRARNTGWKAASGDIISFTDDDCYVATDYAENVVLTFTNNLDIGFFGGRVLLYDPMDLRITISESQDFRFFKAGELIPAGRIHGANFAFRREALKSSGGFDIYLGAGTPFPAEDIEMLGRLSAQGWNGVYDPMPVVYHHHGRQTEDDRQKLIKYYDIGRGAFFMAMMLSANSRLLGMKSWYWAIRKQSLGRTLHEFRGALGYFVARIMRRA